MGRQVVIYSDELYHHGIKGQRWGDRNGPPYPLDDKDKSSLEKRASDKSSHKVLLSEQQKRYLKIGAAVAVSALAIYGGYRYAKSARLAKLTDNGRQHLSGSVIDEFKDIEDGLGVTGDRASIKTLESFTNAYKLANPDYNPSDMRWKNSCSHGAIASCLRFMGFPVKAKGMSFDEEGGISFNELGRYFSGFRENSFTIQDAKSYSDISDRILSFCRNEDGACGILDMSFIGGSTGHFISWANVGGVIQFGDANNPAKNANQYFRLIGTHINSRFNILRVDTCGIKINRIREAVGRL